MKKTILVIGVLASFFSWANVSAQAPKISYPMPSDLVVGKAITPIKPVHTGGSVPNLLFSSVSNVAGSGFFGQKDTLAAFATFNYVISTAKDSKGNIYVADAGSNAIRKISANGVVTTFAGSAKGEKGNLSAPGTSALFNFPTSIAIGKNDTVYVADCLNNIIRKISPNGNVFTVAGDINPGYENKTGIDARFRIPYAICFDLSGNLLVADAYNNVIRKITPLGVVTTLAGTGSAGTGTNSDDGRLLSAKFTAPKGIAVDRLGNIYVTEAEEYTVGGVGTGKFYNTVRKINTNRGIVNTFATVPFDGPVGIAVDGRNNVYVSSLRKYNIYRFTPDGKRMDPYSAFSGGNLYNVANGTDTLTKYKGNMGLAYDGENHVIIADAYAGMIRKAAVNGYQIYPRLPDGLILDNTGAITGTPTKISKATRYTIYAYNNAGADSTVITLSVAQGTQTITFNKLPEKTYGDADFSPGATSTNTTIPIVYTSSDASIASIENNNVRIKKNGTVTITASQAANANYKAAISVTQRLVIKEDVTITYPLSNTFTVNQAITPVKPSGIGGIIPELIYSTASAIAGDGTYGSKDDVAAQATFRYPLGSAKDASGNIYVADAGSHSIRKISASGIVSTFAGSANGEKGTVNGKGTAARFNYPTSVAIDVSGNIYVADQLNNMIRKITSDGNVSTFAGNVNSGSTDAKGTNARFTQPYGIAFNRNGDLFVADTYNNKLRKVARDGTVTTVAGSGAPGHDNGEAINATLNLPKSLAIDGGGDIYITEEGNNTVRKITAADNKVSDFANGPFIKPVGITLDNSSNVYVSSADLFTIYKFRPNGSLEDAELPFSGGKFKGNTNGTDTLTTYRGSMGLFYDGDNHIIVSDPASYQIRKVAVNGYRVSPRLPVGLKLDSLGNISGTPEVISPEESYTITAFNNRGYGTAVTKIAVGIGSQTITFNSLPVKIYGDADFFPGAISTNASTPITYTSSNEAVAKMIDGKVHIVGVGSSVITANQAGSTNYTAAAAVVQTLQVNKAPLLITADNKIKTINKENPELTLTFAGFVNGENSSVLQSQPIAATSVDGSTAAGKYPINASGASAANYEISYKTGEFTVFPVPQIIARGATNIIKGGSVLLSAVPGAGYTYQWSFNGANISGATNSTYDATQTGAYSVAITDANYTTASLPISVTAQLQLPADNFTIKVNSTSCKGSNDGSISITVKNIAKYTAVITGNGNTALYNFTDQLKINNLPPGSFTICFSVEGEIFNQCSQVNVTEPQDLALYSVVNTAQSTLTMQLSGGSTYNIRLNNVDYTTTSKQFTVPLSSGINKLSVTTDKLCQGVIEKEIDMGMVLPFPNPFVSSVKVNVGNRTVGNAMVKVTDLRNGKTVYQNKYRDANGILEIDLSALESGIYYLNLNLDNQESGYKIIKK
jgi:sugar lactone lactonase YvrE